MIPTSVGKPVTVFHLTICFFDLILFDLRGKEKQLKKSVFVVIILLIKKKDFY